MPKKGESPTLNIRKLEVSVTHPSILFQRAPNFSAFGADQVTVLQSDKWDISGAQLNICFNIYLFILVFFQKFNQ